jgi:hypothetical protein
VLLADIVIIPLSFLQNKQYLEYCESLVLHGQGGLDERIVTLKKRGRNNFG